MSAAASAFAPSRGLFPVTKKPSENSETHAVFVDPVWEQLTPTSFKNIAEFEQWFNKTLVPGVVSDFSEDPKVGRTMIAVAFPHGGIQHFMRWVIVKFTTTKSPEEADLAAAEAAAEDSRSYKKMCPDCVEPKKAPSQGLYVVTRKPSEDSETKAVFVPLVWGQITSTPFLKNIEEFKEWFKPLLRRVVSDFGEDPKVGLTTIKVAFGGINHFMRWVMTKFTTTKSPGAAAEDKRDELRAEHKKFQVKKRSAKEMAAMLEFAKTEVVIHSSKEILHVVDMLSSNRHEIIDVVQELLEPRNNTTMTIQDLSEFLTTIAFDALVEKLSGMPYTEKGWRQCLVDKFCRKKVILSEENYEEEFQQNLREIKGRFGNWVIKYFTSGAEPVAKKSKSSPKHSLPKSYPGHQVRSRWDTVEKLKKGSDAYEGSAASVKFVGDTFNSKSFKRQDLSRAFLKSYPGQVVFENCTPEEALLALWKEADVLGFGWLQQDGNPPTLEECRKAANRGYVDYLKGKPIKAKFQNFPVLRSVGYDRDNGAGKMQRVADMLSAADPVVLAEVVEVGVAVPLSEEGHAPMPPSAE